jgi:ceramide glucosyltransferase
LDQNLVPHVTIIRPAKGLEPHLYDCIASTFRQDYPLDKITIYLCVAEISDPAYPVLKKLESDFPHFDCRVLVEGEDPLLHGVNGDVHNLGPNPKVRNISRAYREAKGDIVWIVDCNVWIGRGATGHMVDKLLGLRPEGEMATPCKFVHQLPIVVDTVNLWQPDPVSSEALLSSAPETMTSSDITATGSSPNKSWTSRIWDNGGGRLDEMFMATTHAKFYSAINTVGIAPCVVGKSNMFRKSHLDMLTDPSKNPDLPADRDLPIGIDYFSSSICEDHLIGDMLFKSKIPGFADHGLIYDLAVQPMAGFSVHAYYHRRARWLRARKWTVPAATLVEPGVESLLCCAYFSFAITTIPWFNVTWGIPQTWTAMFMAWLLSITLWIMSDWILFRKLHSGDSMLVDSNTPFFARGTASPRGVPRRPLYEWVATWLGREFMALPIWIWAVLCGATVDWRGNRFLVKPDMTVVELDKSPTPSGARSRNGRTPEMQLGRARSKNRVD